MDRSPETRAAAPSGEGPVRRTPELSRSAWAALLTAILGLGCAGGSAVGYEEPTYGVVERFDAFEVRRYAPYLAAETEVSGDFEEVGGEAFRLLAGFISGKNRRGEELAMTAPVTQEPAAGEKIAMTVPVTQAPSAAASGDRSYVFQFVMPSEYTRDTLPEPTDPRVRIREVPARLVAARRFSGTWRRANYLENETALLEAVRAAGFEPAGPPVFARYNAPFVPWFLRRNEVLVEVRD